MCSTNKPYYKDFFSLLTGDVPHISTSSEAESEDSDSRTTMPSGYSPSHEASDILYMMMHIVPGFTIFHKSHSDSTARFRDGKTDADGLLDPSGLKSSPSDLSRLLNLVESEPSPSTLTGQSKTAVAIQAEDTSSKTVSSDAAAAEGNASKDETATSEEQDPNSRRCLERHSNPYFSLCLALLSLAFGYLLVHGVISRQPAHLLPFFCLQVFDFVVALICMLGYMSSASSIGHWLRDKINNNPHFKDHPVTMHPTSIALIMISTSCLILAFKAYCIGMVWDCHRYLLLSNRLGPLRGANARRLPFFWSAVFRRGYPSTEDIDVDLETNPQDAPGAFAAPLPTEPLAESALPKYEEALNTPANAYAPPPYFPNPSKETEAEATPEKSQK